MKISEKFPLQFIQRIKTQLGEQTDAFIAALEEKSPVSVRINPIKKPNLIAGYTVNELKKVDWNENGYYLPERPSFTTDPLFHAGAYYVQEASSMFLSVILKNIIPNLVENAKILDLCASPGGKSSLILDEIPNSMLLVSNEVIKSRASTLSENITKWGKANVVVTSNDPRDFKKLNQYFDLIVIDAPCSGEGMVRKDPKAIDEWSKENVNVCASRQQRIVEDILPSLKPNGYIIYCTCTFAPSENRENLQTFISQYKLKSIEIPVDSVLNIDEESSDGIFSYHFYPHKIKGEGFFIGCMQKLTEEEVEIDSRGFRFEFLNKKQIPILERWVSNAQNFDFTIWKDVITALPKHLTNEISILSKNLFIVKKGIEVGKLMGDDIIPSHELALSEIVNPEIFTCELLTEEALVYLKKGDVSAFEAIQHLPNGWALIQYQGKNLGWVKKIGHRTNNYLPKEMRILKDL